MKKEREKLNKLLKDKKKIESEINSLTRDESGVPYGKKLQSLLMSRIDQLYPKLNSVEKYKVYSEVRSEIGKIIGTKGQTLTNKEFNAAVEIIHTKF